VRYNQPLAWLIAPSARVSLAHRVSTERQGRRTIRRIRLSQWSVVPAVEDSAGGTASGTAAYFPDTSRNAWNFGVSCRLRRSELVVVAGDGRLVGLELLAPAQKPKLCPWACKGSPSACGHHWSSTAPRRRRRAHCAARPSDPTSRSKTPWQSRPTTGNAGGMSIRERIRPKFAVLRTCGSVALQHGMLMPSDVTEAVDTRREAALEVSREPRFRP